MALLYTESANAYHKINGFVAFGLYIRYGNIVFLEVLGIYRKGCAKRRQNAAS